VRVPLLLVIARHDRLTPPEPAVEVAATLQAVEIVELSGSHFDAYTAEFAASSQAAIA
jgi:pimeloyl-ACP methyl ester carboxylesterase